MSSVALRRPRFNRRLMCATTSTFITTSANTKNHADLAAPTPIANATDPGVDTTPPQTLHTHTAIYRFAAAVADHKLN